MFLLLLLLSSTLLCIIVQHYYSVLSGKNTSLTVLTIKYIASVLIVSAIFYIVNN